MHIQHELSERAVQMSDFAAHESKTRTGKFGCRIEVQTERSTDIHMVLNGEVERTRRTPAAHFHIFRFILADRRGGRRQIRHTQHQVVKLFTEFLEFILERFKFTRNSSCLSEQLGSILPILLHHADVLGERIAAGLQLFGLLLDRLAALLKFVEGVHGEIEIARLQASHHFREVLPEHRHIEHVLICPKGKKQSAARICGQRA